MREQLSMVWLVTQRELRDQIRDWRIIFPLLVLTIFFPFLMNFTAREILNFVNRYGATLVGERLVPFLLMVVGFFPITVSLVIALESFVGEKERGTIEPLLSSPLQDWQLYMGKLLAATIAPLFTAYLGIVVYLTGLYLQGISLPSPNLLVQTIALTTVQAVLMVSGAIVISTQSTSVRAANLLSSFIIIPAALLIQGESTLMFFGNNNILWLAVLGVLVMAILLVRVGLAHFQRESLLGREIDVLNLRWIGRTFRGAFIGQARSLVDWYRCEIPKAMHKMAVPLVLTLILGLLGGVLGFLWVSGNVTNLPSITTPEDVSSLLESAMSATGEVKISFPFIWSHNLRAIVIILLLGVFSFGILGTIIYLINMGLIGGVLALISMLGFSPLQLSIAGILPHGIFEIPAVVLSSAAVLYLGAVLVTPTPDRTLGEAFLHGLADWAKVSIGLALPLLTVAAAVETWITPHLMVLVLR